MATHPEFPNAFSPLRIGHTELRNRILVPAHTTNFGADNLPTDRHFAYHRARAAGGAALNIFEGIRVHPSSLGRQQGVNGYDPACIPRFARLAEAVRAEGGRLFGQVIHLGRHIDGNFARMPAWSASDVPWSATAPPPHPMSVAEIHAVTAAHAEVARNLVSAGLDGIELTMGHGHLLQQFLSPAANLREDIYGGCAENRLRFPLETLRAVRAAVGPDTTLGIRISADEFLPGGLGLADMTGIVRALCRDVQVDFVNVSHSAYHGSYTVSTQMADMAFPRDIFQPLTRGIAAALDGIEPRPAVLTVCRYTRVAEAESMLATGAADMVGMARAHIADPEIVNKARTGRAAETTPCIGCNQGCAGMLALNLAITCLTNPRAGREADLPAPALAPCARPKRIAVVGAGPAGLEAAAVAAERGHDVTVWDRADTAGGGLRGLLRMPLRAEFGRLIARQTERIGASGGVLKLGTEAPATIAEADAVVWAAGAEARAQDMPSGRVARTLQAALADPDGLGARVVLVDTLGTWAVVSVAEWLADRGAIVTLVAPAGAPGWTISMYSGFALRSRLRDKGVRIVAGHSLRDWRDDGAHLTDLSLGTPGEVLPCDSVVAPLAARPRPAPDLRRANGEPAPVIAVGDALAARTALEAVYEGHTAALDF